MTKTLFVPERIAQERSTAAKKATVSSNLNTLDPSKFGLPKENDSLSALEKLPNVESVKYMFSDTQNRFISYSITETSDLIDRGIKSLQYSGHTEATQLKLKGNDCYIIGTDFPTPVSLRNQKFNFQVDTTSTSLSGTPYLAWLYFHTLISL